MLNVDDLKRDFWEKLSYTGSLDQAFVKAVWNAYKQGIEDGKVVALDEDKKSSYLTNF